MTEIIGREKEKSKLDIFFDSKEAEFAAVYGRRRVGKTYLIRNFFQDKPCIFFQISGIIKAKTAVQLKEFKKALEEAFYSQLKGTRLETPKNWMNALEMLHDAINLFGSQKKVVLFFDEFPWLAIRKKQLLQAIDYYWNRHWSMMPNIRLIICGSAASWIINNILNNKAGLHNRITLKLPIEPFTLKETQAYLHSKHITYNQTQVLQLYLCLGGIPYYLKGVDGKLSAIQNVNQLCFQKGGALSNEFDNLFSSLFDHSEAHETIIKVIEKKPQGIAREEIEKAINRKGGKLSTWLKELEHAGFILAFTPFGRKKGLFYKIIDEYVLFYLQWVEPYRNSLMEQETGHTYWEQLSKTAGFKAWSGYAFEAVCFKHLAKIRAALSIPEGSFASTWQHRAKTEKETGAQIDLLFDRPDGVITICEIKYANQPFKISKEEAMNLKRKVEIYQKITKTPKQIFISMITTHGLIDSIYKEDLIVSEATLKDFFI
jgi:predicted AAA+ superfamily ATPase